MRDKTHPFILLSVAFVLLLAAFAFYLSHLPINHTYDGMVFATYVESPDTPLYKMFHPHHLLFNPMGRVFYQWGVAHGAAWDGLTALQIMDTCLGVSGLIILFLLVHRLTGGCLPALLASTGLALTYSYWYFSTTPAVRILAAVTPLFAWYVLAASTRWGWARGPVLGVAHLLAVLGHQTNLLLVPAFLAGLWAEPGIPWRQKRRDTVLYLTTLIVTVGGVYAFVGRFVVLRTTFEKWVWWITSYLHVGAWGGNLKSSGLEQGQSGMTLAFLGSVLSTERMSNGMTYGAARTVLFWALLGAVLLGLLGARALWREQRPALLVIFLWWAAFVPFFLWWEPWNIEFWVASTIPFWVFLGLVLNRWSRPILWGGTAVSAARRWMLASLALSAVSLMGLYNYEGKIRKSPETYAHRTLLAALEAKVRTDDLLVVSGTNTIPLYLDRFQKREYVSLMNYLQRVKKSEERASKKKGVKKARASKKPDAFEGLDAAFKSTWKKRRRVFVLKEAVAPSNAYMSRIEVSSGLKAGSFRKFIARYPNHDVKYAGKFFFIEVKKPPEPPRPPIPAPVPAAPP